MTPKFKDKLIEEVRSVDTRPFRLIWHVTQDMWNVTVLISALGWSIFCHGCLPFSWQQKFCTKKKRKNAFFGQQWNCIHQLHKTMSPKIMMWRVNVSVFWNAWAIIFTLILAKQNIWSSFKCFFLLKKLFFVQFFLKTFSLGSLPF